MFHSAEVTADKHHQGCLGGLQDLSVNEDADLLFSALFLISFRRNSSVSFYSVPFYRLSRTPRRALYRSGLFALGLVERAINFENRAEKRRETLGKMVKSKI